MTAVPAKRTNAKDPFQKELDAEIAKRRSKGMSTGFTDDEDDYEEDFQSDGSSDDELLKQYLPPAKQQTATKHSSKWMPQTSLDQDSYNDEDDSFIFKSKFASKGSSLSSSNAAKKSLRSGIGRQPAVEHERSVDSNPLLSLLDDDTHHNISSTTRDKDSIYKRNAARPLSPHSVVEKNQPLSPSTKFDARRPLSPSTKFDGTRPLSPSTKFDGKQPLSPSTKFDAARPLSPYTKFDGTRPLSPSNKFDGKQPLSPSTKFYAARPLSPSTKFDGTRPLPPSTKFDATQPLSPSTKFDGTRPLSPSTKFDGTQPLSPSTKFDAKRPLSPSTKFDGTRPLSPSNKFDGTRPLSPSTKFDGTQPLSPYRKFDGTQPLSPSTKFDATQSFSNRKSSERPLSPTHRNKTQGHSPMSAMQPMYSLDRTQSTKAINQPEVSVLSPRSRVSHGVARMSTTQSVIDSILEDPQPTPAPRSKSSFEHDIDSSTSLARSRRRRRGSAKSSTSEQSEDPKSVKLQGRNQVNPIENTTRSSNQEFLSSLPSLAPAPQTGAYHESGVRSNKMLEDQRSNVKLSHAGKGETATNADDLLALYNQTTISHETRQSNQLVDSHAPTLKEETLNPAEAVVKQTADQSEVSSAKQRHSQQLIENAIDNVAVHNETYILREDNQQDAVETAQPKSPCSRSGKLRKPKKSSRTPPAHYKGLGSLSSLQQLQTYKITQNDANLNSTADLRQTAYMQWLADREKKLLAKKKLEREAEEKEKEKKEKELEDKKLDGESARRAWKEDKLEKIKERERQKKREQKRIRSEKLKEEEEKWKSKKKADVVRDRMLEEAKKQHREDVKKQRDEALLQKKKEKDKEKENHKAMDQWMEKRSKQWEEERKAEMKEKRRKKKQEEEAHRKRVEDASAKYIKWHEKKEKESKVNRHPCYDDEERPPWSPANKVIPRQR